MATASVAAVGAALVSQHAFGMEPCPWCVLQRAIFLAIALACVLGVALQFAVNRRTGQLAGGVGALLLSLCGVAAALWQHFVAAASASCNLTLADTIIGALKLDSLAPEVFSARASCADAAVDLLGVPYEFWSLALYVLLALGAALTLRSAVRG